MNEFWKVLGRIVLTAWLFAVAGSAALAAPVGSQPNIIVVLADDLGYGDLRCLNPEAKIATPHLDQLATEGMVFTDAHSGSSVCTPTRYGLLTGRYAWRTKLQSGVLGGLSPPLIQRTRTTVASFLKRQGYQTDCVGKWHLGLGWRVEQGKEVNRLSIETREQVWNVDYAMPFNGGPIKLGFDRFYGIAGSLDMVPYTFLENDHVRVMPTEDRDFPLMHGRPTGRCRMGPAAPGFEVVDVLPKLAARAVATIDARAAAAKDGQPFFLYMPLASPHTPIEPTPDWIGKSGLNPYGDFVMQTDACIGAVLAAVDRHGLRENTLVIVTSDNGCSPQADFQTLRAKGHDPSGPLRGHKADIFEGGHRVPFIARWPAVVPAGTRTGQLVCLTDLLATASAILGEPLADNEGEDSFSMLPTLKDPQADSPRTSCVHHSINGSFAVRAANWKLCFCPDSGGWSEPRPNRKRAEALPPRQLYDLSSDPGEQMNLVATEPAVVAKLEQQLKQLVDSGRSTPGAPQQNDVAVRWER